MDIEENRQGSRQPIDPERIQRDAQQAIARTQKLSYIWNIIGSLENFEHAMSIKSTLYLS